MSKFVPNGWENQRLDELSKVVDSAHQTPIFSNFGIPMVRVGDINGGKVSLANTKLVTDDIYRIFAKNHEPKFNDVLMTRVGSYGRSSIVKTSKKFCLGQNTVVISPRKMNSDFLYQFLQTENINNQIEDTVGGSSQKSLSLGAIKSLRVLTPPFPEQQKIAKILTSVDDVIETTQAQIDKLKDLKTGMMQELLTNGIGHTEFKDSPVGIIPAEWDCIKMNNVAKVTDGAHFTPTYTSEGVPFLRVTDLKNKSILSGNIKYIPFNEHEELIKRCNPEKGDILFSKNGTIGLTRLIDWEGEFSIFVSLALIKILSAKVTSEYLTLFMESPIVKYQIKSRSKQGSVTNLHLEEIRDFDIPLPTVVEQFKIVKMLSSIIEKLDSVKIKHESLIKLKKALMQDLLTGKVRVKVDSE
ncbi:restriction endonuclease subunit S [Pseudoalteromonas sp. 3-MNA-CIBAN-0064]|uniref:restriction endonuclease subunit S n=1 Tax=unclassified Pseudoalteromonas TaxID=194690 RepID=UPI00331C7809